MLADRDELELETFIKSIDVADGQGKEIVMQVNTSYNNNKTCYTDTNGLEMIKRIYNFRQ